MSIMSQVSGSLIGPNAFDLCKISNMISCFSAIQRRLSMGEEFRWISSQCAGGEKLIFTSFEVLLINNRIMFAKIYDSY